MESFYPKLQSILQKDARFCDGEGRLLRNRVREAAMQLDEGLFRLLLSDEETKARFFQSVDGILIFDKIAFGWVLNHRAFLPDSYTRFRNRIGLADEAGELVCQTGRVELVFPYKDCVLEGGQTKEDAKRDEIFYNEALAPQEIDRLLAPKAFRPRLIELR